MNQINNKKIKKINADISRPIKKIMASADVLQDARNIAHGIYAPLKGFLCRTDFQSVLNAMRLADNTVWSIPIVLDISEQDYDNIKNETAVALLDRRKEPKAILEHIEVYPYDKKEYAEKVFGTTDSAHPGVQEIFEKGPYLVGGDIQYLGDDREPFSGVYFTPAETKALFQKLGWKTVVAFQTRNVPHRSHEYLQKTALQNIDGLFIQPVIGKKKPGDFKDELIIQCYQELLKRYYPETRYVFGILPMKMNYAGPRDAIFHAIIRKNYGCTHFIIGRDHAGVGNFYHPFAAQEIFKNFRPEEIGITILPYDNAAYCTACGEFTTPKTCSHEDAQKLSLSGTKIRTLVQNKEPLPEHFTRPEIAAIIRNYPNPFVE